MSLAQRSPRGRERGRGRGEPRKQQSRHQARHHAGEQIQRDQCRRASASADAAKRRSRRLAKPGANIVALCDIDADVLDKTAANFPGAKTYTDFRKMLEKQKDIDAVVVATPDHTHAPAAMMAMRMGKHVYCEKPLTYDIHEARTLTEAASEYNVVDADGQPGHGHRRQPPAGRVRPLRRRSGAITEVHIYTDRPIWPQGMQPPDRHAGDPQGRSTGSGSAPRRASVSIRALPARSNGAAGRISAPARSATWRATS